MIRTVCSSRLGSVGQLALLCWSDKIIETDFYCCPCYYSSVKALRCTSTGSIRRMNSYHDILALSLSSGRVKFPGFTTWRCRIRFPSPLAYNCCGSKMPTPYFCDSVCDNDDCWYKCRNEKATGYYLSSVNKCQIQMLKVRSNSVSWRIVVFFVAFFLLSIYMSVYPLGSYLDRSGR